MASYTNRYVVDSGFDETVEAVVDALDDEGFGVLCDIDVKATLKEKLGEDYRKYRILGACNPPLAHEAMAEELELGALLPCNVIVYENDDGSVGVSTVDPHKMLSVADNDELDSIAEEVDERLKSAMSQVPDATKAKAE